MTPDRYAGAAADWASGAALVYRPLAAALLARAPHALAGRRVLDVGAGTGLGSTALTAAGARPIALDFSLDMLRWDRGSRPPCAVADVTALPLADDAVEDAFAAFVLNHLPTPSAGLAELARVTAPGGAILASVYRNVTSHGPRDVVDAVALGQGFVSPDWHVELRETMAPQVGTPDALARLASSAGLTGVDVAERAVDVGVRTAAELVRYRFGQAQYAEWFAGLGPERSAAVRAAAEAAVAPVMAPYRPLVLLLRAISV